MTSPPQLTPSAVHEAGHIVVAYALGRRVPLIRMGRQMAPVEHPHTSLLRGSVTAGESRFGPPLATEINRRVEGSPLAASHVEYLRAELVTCLGGTLAETRSFGPRHSGGELADVAQASIVVKLLGISADAGGGAARVARAGRIAKQRHRRAVCKRRAGGD